MTKPTVFVQPPWESSSIRLFSRAGFPIATTMDTADVVVFNGGEDLHPKLYKQTIIPRAHVDWLNEARDELELEAYNRARDKGLFKFGICRGGQLLNVMNGGTLWQDVDGHGRAHKIIDLETGRSIFSSSVHHQMFKLPAKGAHLVATAYEATRKTGYVGRSAIDWYRGDDSPAYNDDPEVVWFAKDRALAIQGHPEYGGYGDFTDYCLDLIERYI